MDAIEAIMGRRSVSPQLMGEPGPSEDDLRTILAAGARAPDHGRLRPWRFLVVRGEARRRLGEVFAEALARRRPGTPEEALAAEAARAMRAPLLIVVAARIQPDHPKIPEVEQIASAAAAAENLLLAAHALGHAGKWSTGPNAYNEHVKARLGLAPHDHVIGLLSFGTLKEAPPAGPPADPAVHAVDWLAPGEERPLGF
jgi:nitroreductase